MNGRRQVNATHVMDLQISFFYIYDTVAIGMAS